MKRRLQAGLDLGHQIRRERAHAIVELGAIERRDLVAQHDALPRKSARASR